MTENNNNHFAVLGAGNIGSAVAFGLAAIAPTAVYNRSCSRLEKLPESARIEKFTNVEKAVANATHVFVCLEGDAVAPMLRQLAKTLAKNRTIVVSCAASPSIKDLKEALQDYDNPPIIRLLPNIASKSGASTNLMCSIGLNGDETYQKTLMERALGPVYDIPEHLFGAAMALSSCGIAYALRYMRAAMNAGIQAGLDAATAKALVCGAMHGAAAMALADENTHPEALIDSVCTPGGLTITGLNELEAKGFSAAVTAGHLAAVKHH